MGRRLPPATLRICKVGCTSSTGPITTRSRTTPSLRIPALASRAGVTASTSTPARGRMSPSAQWRPGWERTTPSRTSATRTRTSLGSSLRPARAAEQRGMRVEPSQAPPSVPSGRKISQDDRRSLPLQQSFPCLPQSQRRRPDPVPTQQVANRGRGDLMTDLSKSPRIRTQPHFGSSFAICRIRFWISGARPGRPQPRRRPKAAHLLLTNYRCQPRTVSGWTSIPIRAARFNRWLSAAMIVRFAMFNCGLLTWRRTTRSWCRSTSSSTSRSWTRSLTSTRSRSSRSQEYTRARSSGGRNPKG
jgi:hypothetical protein